MAYALSYQKNSLLQNNQPRKLIKLLDFVNPTLPFYDPQMAANSFTKLLNIKKKKPRVFPQGAWI